MNLKRSKLQGIPETRFSPKKVLYQSEDKLAGMTRDDDFERDVNELPHKAVHLGAKYAATNPVGLKALSDRAKSHSSGNLEPAVRAGINLSYLVHHSNELRKVRETGLSGKNLTRSDEADRMRHREHADNAASSALRYFRRSSSLRAGRANQSQALADATSHILQLPSAPIGHKITAIAHLHNGDAHDISSDTKSEHIVTHSSLAGQRTFEGAAREHLSKDFDISTGNGSTLITAKPKSGSDRVATIKPITAISDKISRGVKTISKKLGFN